MSLSLHSWPILSDALSTLKQWRTVLQSMKLQTHLRDVELTSLSDDDLLQYNDTSKVWENKSFLNALPVDLIVSILNKIFSNIIKTDWDPTLTASGSMTISSSTKAYAYYFSFWYFTFVFARWSFTTGGTASAYVIVPLPINTSGPDHQFIPIGISDGGNPLNSNGLIRSGSDNIRCYRYDGSNWSLGANREVRLNGIYMTSAP